MTTKSTSVFGTVFSSQMTIAQYAHGQWSEPRTVPYGELTLSPAAHVLHYASTCFEGLKAHKQENGDVRIFRLDRHVKRMIASATALAMPTPSEELLTELIVNAVNSADEIPVTPGSLYIRPTMLGTTANIGSAAAPPGDISLFVITSPVGDYFGGKDVSLRILVNDTQPRSTPQLGFAKTGGNYAAAMGPIQNAKRDYNADQVLFCPEGDVQETGAANFLLIRDDAILTKPLDESFLHGVTRDSVLTIAKDLGYKVEEKNFGVKDMLEWVKTGEAALS
ncbi:MAG: aminotransferase class IV, partial [Pseudomonadota bacterium]